MHQIIFGFTLLILAALSAGPAHAQIDWQTSPRPDGSSIDWSLDLPDAGGRYGLVVIAQGSGCQPVAQNDNLKATRQAFAGFATLFVEKYGIAPDEIVKDPIKACPSTYHQHNTASQRLADYVQILAELDGASWWNGQLVLFGGSMGGSVMARLAPQANADAVVLLSTGGGVTFGEMVLQTVPVEVRPQLEKQFDEIRKHPESTEVWSGYSFRFWADALDRREVDDMLATGSPLLLIQGARDASALVGIARATADLFAEHERCNLTYWEYPGLDHGMSDADGGSHMGSVLAEIAAWVDRAVSQPEMPNCTRPDWRMPAKE